jgi:hypothetical protein
MFLVAMVVAFVLLTVAPPLVALARINARSRRK